MRNFRQTPLNLLPILHNSLKMNNLHNIIVIQDIYFIYIGENISKKLINKIVVRCSKRVVTNFRLNCCITMI